MTTGIYMKFEGRGKIEGESTDSNHKGWIELTGFDHHVRMEVTPVQTAGARTKGNSQHGDFVVHKLTDKATPGIHLYCCKGQSFDRVTVEHWQESGKRVKYLWYEMENVVISDVSISAGADSMPQETIHLNYGKIRWHYQPYDQATHLAQGGVVEHQWSVLENSGG